jgi:hypothetical protein
MIKPEIKQLKIQNDSILLCCGKERCPSVKKSEKDFYEIKDDFGGDVKLNKDQISLLSEAINKLEKMN